MSIVKKDSFVLTADHIKLLRRMFVEWDESETGAPQIDPKRPYGNSDVEGDIVEILGWRSPRNADGELSARVMAKAEKIHAETEIALQILLLSANDALIGEYVKTEDYDDLSWKKVL